MLGGGGCALFAPAVPTPLNSVYYTIRTEVHNLVVRFPNNGRQLITTYFHIFVFGSKPHNFRHHNASYLVVVCTMPPHTSMHAHAHRQAYIAQNEIALI